MLNSMMPYIKVARLHQPWGILLLGWPTITALVLVMPFWDWALIGVFITGIVLVRSAGCVINDYADQWLDGSVSRTCNRPLVNGELTGQKALIYFLALLLSASSLLCYLNHSAQLWSLVCVMALCVYPYCKRVIQMPQLFLGVVFTMGIPMAYFAVGQPLGLEGGLLWLISVYWVFVYDTIYAYSDLEDDKRMEAKSSAVFFESKKGFRVKHHLALILLSWLLWGWMIKVNSYYYLCLIPLAYNFYLQTYFFACREYLVAFKYNQIAGFYILLGVFINRMVLY